MNQEARPGQPLIDHLRKVAGRAEEFGKKFGSPFSCAAAGLLHDCGKASSEWQAYLKTGKNQVSHAPESAALCLQLFGDLWGILPAYAIKAHHSHLPDWDGDLDMITDRLRDRQLRTFAEEELFPDLDAARKAMQAEIRQAVTKSESLQLWVRMTASALVDADRLDAEAFDSPERSALRGQYATWDEFEENFRRYMERKQAEAAPGTVNTVRRAVFEEATEKADGKPGFYTLNVPTGGGKTLCSMAFALKHRRANGMDRIILSIPYNAIIEQTADVYKQIFGAGNVLEHHSNFDPGDNPAYRPAAENWDMPLIVTTNVQLFESLLKSGASNLRKLHNIANSVIILDEAQMLPREHLVPILATLRALVADFGCTVVLCSATIPALEESIVRSDNSRLEGLPPATPLVADPETLAKALRRTRIRHLGKRSPEELAAELAAAGQALCIVNTRRTCRQLYDLVDAPKKIHLSGSMCPAERRKLLAGIRESLKNGEPIVVVATSLVEAGVDLDFKTVYRELAGIDSIAQAAGRCNREGRQKTLGEVFTFDLGNKPPPSLQAGCNAARELLPDDGELVMTPALYRKYFKLYYGMTAQFDKANFIGYFKDAPECEFDSFSADFNMIDNAGQAPLVVLYGNAAELIEELEAAGRPDRDLLRRFQQYTVNVPKEQLEKWRDAACVRTVAGIDVQSAPGLYEPGAGVKLDANGGLWSY